MLETEGVVVVLQTAARLALEAQGMQAAAIQDTMLAVEEAWEVWVEMGHQRWVETVELELLA
jgi:hypothetical protein